MKRIHRRLAKAAKTREGLATLSGALFGGQGVSYAARRGGFAFVRSGITSFFHSIEAAALALVLDSPYLVAIVTVRLVAGLASALIWGLTESLRQDVRIALGNKDSDAARQRIELALARSVWLGILLSAFGVAWVFAFPHLRPGLFSVVDAYAIALSLRTGVSLVTRTYASGMNAVQRVHRPRWSMLLPDILDVAGLFLFWRLMGPWSVAFAVFGSSLVQAALTYRYTKAAYVVSSFGPRKVRVLRGLVPDVALALRNVRFVLAGLTFELPTWVLLGMWSQLNFLEGGLLLYAARPIANFVLNIPRLYYIDMVAVKKLGALADARLRRHVRAFALVALTLVIGALLVALSTTRASIDAGILLGFVLFLTVAVFFVIDVLHSIVAHREGRAAIAATLVLLILFFAEYRGVNPTGILFLASISLILVTALVRFGRQKAAEAVPVPDTVLDLPVWLSRLKARTNVTAITVLRVAPEMPGHTARLLALRLATAKQVDVTRVGQRYVLIAASPRPNEIAHWSQEAQGAATVVATERASSAQVAFSRLRKGGALPSPLSEALQRTRTNEKAVRAWVSSHAPSAVVLDARKGECKDKVGSFGALAASMRNLLGQRPPAPSEWNHYDLALYAPRGQAELLVCVPRAIDARLRTEVRTHLWQASLAESAPE